MTYVEQIKRRSEITRRFFSGQKEAEIVRDMGLHPGVVSKHIQRLKRQVLIESAEQRKQELVKALDDLDMATDRLLIMIDGLDGSILTPREKILAIATLIQATVRRGQFLGIFTEKHELSGPGGLPIPIEYKRLSASAIDAPKITVVENNGHSDTAPEETRSPSYTSI